MTDTPNLATPPAYIHPELEAAVDHLGTEFAGVHARETVAAVVEDSYRQLSRSSRIPAFLPLLAERFARDRLRATTRIEGQLMTDRPEVLFVCVHNAGRSQMAAALLDHHAQGAVLVRSAGSAPGGSINPAVVEVMDELGIDLSREFPKPLTTEAVQASDVVITMGCGDACPVFPGKRYLDWQLDDPAGQDVDTVRRIRDQIDARVRGLLAELAPTHRAS